MLFAQRLSLLLDDKGITAYRLRKDLSLSNSIVTYWMDGTRLPNGESLIKLAEYFGVSIDYLVGRTDIRELNVGNVIQLHPPQMESTHVVAIQSAAYDGPDVLDNKGEHDK